MPVSESQLTTWSGKGSTTQSAATYTSVKRVIELSDAPYSGWNFSTFLQGSYGNDTNIWSDSDVDIVACLSSTYYYNIDDIGPDRAAQFKNDLSPVLITYDQFKAGLITQLTKHFGNDVEPQKKAILIKGNGTRRDADVLPAAEYRKYTSYFGTYNQNYIEGICFWTPYGEQIVNYPKQHSQNCTTKHQNTGQWFKPCVRILKNMRNRMIDANLLPADLAPSYFLEGMLYNAPNRLFGGTYISSISSCLNWLQTCNRDSLTCANGMHPLFNAASSVSWKTEKFEQYLTRTITFWNDWTG